MVPLARRSLLATVHLRAAAIKHCDASRRASVAVAAGDSRRMSCAIDRAFPPGRAETLPGGRPGWRPAVSAAAETRARAKRIMASRSARRGDAGQRGRAIPSRCQGPNPHSDHGACQQAQSWLRPSADFVRALYAAVARVRARRLAGSAFLGFEEPCCPPVHADAARSAPGTPAGAVTVVRLSQGPREAAVALWPPRQPGCERNAALGSPVSRA